MTELETIESEIKSINIKLDLILRRFNIPISDHDHDHDPSKSSKSYDPDRSFDEVLAEFYPICEQCNIDPNEYNLESVNRSIRWVVSNRHKITNMVSYLSKTLAPAKNKPPKQPKMTQSDPEPIKDTIKWTEDEKELAMELTADMIKNSQVYDAIISKYCSISTILKMSILRLYVARMILEDEAKRKESIAS